MDVDDVALQSLLSSENFKTLRKHAYSNILKISPPKTVSFADKSSDGFHIPAQKIDYGYLLENNVYPYNPRTWHFM